MSEALAIAKDASDRPARDNQAFFDSLSDGQRQLVAALITDDAAAS